jgi:hypothetical protein
VTLDVMERPTTTIPRLMPRSSLATANVELARRTVAELAQPPQGLEEAGSRVLARLRQIVGRTED